MLLLLRLIHDASPATLALAATGLLTACLLCVPIYNVFFHPLRKIPGPLSYAATRIPNVFFYKSGKAHLRMLELHRKYGDVVRISPDEVSVMNEYAWEELMGHRKQGAGEHGKDPVFFVTHSHSLISADRDSHARMRRTLAHGFSASSIAQQEPIISSYVDLLMRRLGERADGGKAALDMTSWYNWTTFDIIGDLAFGESFGCLEKAVYHPWVKIVFQRVRGNHFNMIARRWGRLSKFVRAFLDNSSVAGFNTHLTLMEEKLAKRAEMDPDRPDYYNAMTEGDRKYSHLELVDTSSLLIIAGSETTATTLSAVTYFLTKHPHVLQKLTEEVRTTFSDESEITLHSVARLSYMLAVLDETLRMYPPVPMAIPRKAHQDGAMIGGHWIAGGTSIGIWQYVMYHSEKYYSLPESFIPERWLGDERFANDTKRTFQPFSFGPRNCLGRNLAYAEMRLILARIIWKFDMQLDRDSDNWNERSDIYLFWEKPALNIHLVPRAN